LAAKSGNVTIHLPDCEEISDIGTDCAPEATSAGVLP
jgi:hypothetical protein